jgi:hypothetical protein
LSIELTLSSVQSWHSELVVRDVVAIGARIDRSHASQFSASKATGGLLDLITSSQSSIAFRIGMLLITRRRRRTRWFRRSVRASCSSWVASARRQTQHLIRTRKPSQSKRLVQRTWPHRAGPETS